MQSAREPNEDGSGAPRQRSRLPVNPRRVKVAPEQRKRVVRACNACNVRRVKCSGDQPCERCERQSRDCEYPAPESDKGALKNEVDYLRKRCAALEDQLATLSSAADVSQQLDRGDSASCSTPPNHRTETVPSNASEASDGRMLRDPDGTVRHLGETSGANFLDVLKNFMYVLVSWTFQEDCRNGSSFVSTIGQYQTFDSRPLPNPDVDSLWLPSRTEMSTMLVELRYYIQDGNGDFLSGGIYWWGDLSIVPSPGISSASLNTVTTDDSFRYLAFYHVCFALASSIGHTAYRASEQRTGGAYFKRARVLIGNPLDTVRFTLSDVAVLTLMAFYLIEINRRDAAYMYLGLAVRIAVIHGAFRSSEDEQSKRVMWTVYILDRWLSVLMGRPPTIADEAIRLALPIDVAGLPSSAGLRAHVELSRISNYIVCETLRIAPRRHEFGYLASCVNPALNMLQTWLLQLPPSLQMPENLAHPDPTCSMLHMAHNQLQVLATRPIFFAAVKEAVGLQILRGEDLPEEFEKARIITTCPAAAHRNLLLAQRLVTSGRKLLQAGLHFVFNGAVILLLKRLMRFTMKIAPEISDMHNFSSPFTEEEFEVSIRFAIKVFEEEARTGTHYHRDCCRILQDLNELTDRVAVCYEQLMRQRNTPDHFHPGSDTDARSRSATDVQASQLLVGEGDAHYAEMMSWIDNFSISQLPYSLCI